MAGFSRRGRARGLAAAGAAAMTAASPANAFIVHSDELRVYSSGGSEPGYFDLYADAAKAALKITWDAESRFLLEGENGTGFHAIKIGDVVTPEDDFLNSLAIKVEFTTGPDLVASPFAGGEETYLGYKVYPSENPTPNYGWLRLATGESGDGLPVLRLEAFAYETEPGASIVAGRTATTIPLPGAGALALGGAGLFAAAKLRRRRRREG